MPTSWLEFHVVQRGDGPAESNSKSEVGCCEEKGHPRFSTALLQRRCTIFDGVLEELLILF